MELFFIFFTEALVNGAVCKIPQGKWNKNHDDDDAHDGTDGRIEGRTERRTTYFKNGTTLPSSLLSSAEASCEKADIIPALKSTIFPIKRQGSNSSRPSVYETYKLAVVRVPDAATTTLTGR